MAKKVHTILLGVEGSVYQTLNHLKGLGLDIQTAL